MGRNGVSEEKVNDDWGFGTSVQVNDLSPLATPFYAVKAGSIDLYPGVIYDLNVWANMRCSTALTDMLASYSGLHGKYVYPTMPSGKYHAFSLSVYWASFPTPPEA